MKPLPGPPLTDDELHALADAQGSPETLEALRSRLADDPQAKQRLLQWQRQRDALRGLYTQVLQEAVPTMLSQAVGLATSTTPSYARWRYGGLAATVLMAFWAGWFANAQWPGSPWHNNAPSMAYVQLERDFLRQAGLAHRVYVPEVRHPVEVTATEQAHLVQWLSKRLGKPLKVPDLSTYGFELVGGRLLPGEAGARALFMFQNTAGNRVTLYLGAVDAQATNLSDKETGFRFDSQAGIPSFYWIDQGFGYALAGQLSRESLMKLADLVYRQL
ncbi:MAG: anti-sigma factor [Comamonadaceae bacterium]|nr:anti-sigma factor [Comamonadaceae bacterium]